MRIIATLIIVIPFIMTSCGGPPHAAEEAQTDPTALAETIIYLIKNQKYDALPALIDEEADEDSKDLIALKDADETKKKLRAEYFESASLSDPVINGDKASVKITLRYDFEETFEMVKKDEKWYLLAY